jgi:hypothetical protein
LTDVEATPQLWTGLQEKIEKVQSAIYQQPLVYFQNLFINNYRDFHPYRLQVAALTIIAALGIVGVIKYKFSDSQQEQNIEAYQENLINKDPTPKNEIASLDDNEDANLRAEQTFTVKKNQFDKVENRRRKNVLSLISSKRENRIAVSKTTNFTRKQSSDEVVRKVEQQYINAIAILTQDIKQRRGEKVSFDVLAQAQTVLTDLDRTIENTRRAVREQPQNPIVVQYMTAAYAKKIEMLRTMAEN